MVAPTGRSETTVNAVWRLIVRLTAIGLVVFAGYRLRSIITTICVGAIIAYVLDPAVEWMARRPGFIRFHTALGRLFASVGGAFKRNGDVNGASSRYRISRRTIRTYATLYVFVLAAIVAWKGTTFIATPFVAEIASATSPAGRQQAMENKEHLIRWYNEKAPDWAKAEKIEQQVRKMDVSKWLMSLGAQAGEKLLGTLGNIVEIVLLPVLAFYFIIDGSLLKREFVVLVPGPRRRETMRMLREFNRIMRDFVSGQFILCLLAGVVVGTGLALLHVKYPVIMGVLAGITRAIPIIGPIIGGIPIILLTLATKGVPTALAVLGFFTFLHFAESKFIMPMLIGDRMDLHPVVIIVVLLIGGEMGGLLVGGSLGSLLGMFFAAPVTALVRVMVRRYWLRLPTKPARRAPAVSAPAASANTAPAALPEIVN